MTDVRAVRAEELDTFLALMCEAFGLPYQAARDIFYKDPYFDRERKRVLVENGTILSCLTIVDAQLWIGESHVHVAGIAGVATRQTHRNKGYASRLLVETLPTLREMEYGFSALFPYAVDFYRRLGWETVGIQQYLTLSPPALPSFTEARYVRNARPSDKHDMARLYDRETSQRTGWWLRDEKRWDYLFHHIGHKVVFKQNQLEGYALYEQQEGLSLRLLELMAATEAAQRGILSYLNQQKPKEITFATDALSLTRNGLLAFSSEPPPPRMEILPGVMFRIIDFLKALENIKQNWPAFEGTVLFVLRDAKASANTPLAVLVEGDGEEVSLTSMPGSSRAKHTIEGDAGAWAQVLTGYYSLEDAVSLRRLRTHSPTAANLVSPLFPRRNLFIPPADHF